MGLRGNFGEAFTKEPAYILIRKGSGWKVELLGHKLGFGNAQPIASGARRAVLRMTRRELSIEYRAYIEGDESESLAIVLLSQSLFFEQGPQTGGGLRRVTSAASGKTLHFDVSGYGLVSVKFTR